jgi:hypothetical protein
MQLGMMTDVGRMNANIVSKATRGGHACVAFDVDAAVLREPEAEASSRSPRRSRPRLYGLDHGLRRHQLRAELSLEPATTRTGRHFQQP